MHALSKSSRIRRALLASGLLASAVFMASSGTAVAERIIQRNLVSDIQGLADLTDASLRNPWGMSFGPSTPFWISDQATSLSTLYTVQALGVTKAPLVVSIPMTGSGPQGPTGQVFNNTNGFLLNGNPSRFIFANLNGTISAWNNSAGTTAQIQVPATPGTVYTGLAINTDANLGPLLYAANTAGGEIEVYDSTFTELTLPGAFVDPDPAVAGLVPFNVQSIGNNVYVTYAPPGRPAQISAPRGEGAVAVFDTAGNFIRTLVSDGRLASPWGVTIAPSSGFGRFSGDLLVGNFSFVASEINAFDPVTGTFRGTIPIDMTGFAPGGLWALAFGNGASGGAHTLFFTDGINGEVNGLFASITVIPEPGTLLLLAAAFAGLVLASRARG